MYCVATLNLYVLTIVSHLLPMMCTLILYCTFVLVLYLSINTLFYSNHAPLQVIVHIYDLLHVIYKFSPNCRANVIQLY